MASLSKQDYERALSQATGDAVILTDQDYQRLLKGQKLSESALNAAKTRGKNAGDDFAEPDGQPLLTPDKPAETYKPVVKGPNAPASSTVGKIQMPGMAPPVVADGPALGVDSAGIGSSTVPKYAQGPMKGPDYGSADLPYTGMEFGLPDAGDKISAKAPLFAQPEARPSGGIRPQTYAAAFGGVTPKVDPMQVAASHASHAGSRSRWDEAEQRWVPELEELGLQPKPGKPNPKLANVWLPEKG